MGYFGFLYLMIWYLTGSISPNNCKSGGLARGGGVGGWGGESPPLPPSLYWDLVKVLTNCCLTILLTGVWKQEGSKLSCRRERRLSLGPYSLSTPSYQPIQSSSTEQHSRHSHPPTHSTLIFYTPSFILTLPLPVFPHSSFLHVHYLK